MNNHLSRRAAVLRRWALGLLFIIGIAAIAFVEMRQAPGPYIDFNKVEDADPVLISVYPIDADVYLRLDERSLHIVQR